MSASTVVSHAAVPTPSRANSAAEPREDAAPAGHFDRQLHAARQRNDAKGADHSSHNDRQLTPAARQSDKQSSDATHAVDASASTPVPPSAVTGETGQPPETTAKAPADTSEPDDQAASALAGAMLALLGPSVAAVLRPAAAAAKAAALVQTGKTVASDAKAAALLQLDGADSALAAPVTTTPVAAGMLLAAPGNGPLPLSETGKDPSNGFAQALALSAPPAPAAPTTPHVLQLQSPVGSQSFGQDLGQQVTWLGSQNIKQARIRLHPEELGSLDVSISVTHGRVDVVFSAHHPAAVAAVQQSLPQLDQMLAQHGLSLGHAEVGQHDHGGRHGGHAGEAGAGALDDAGDIHGIGSTVSLGKVGLLDAFA